MNVKIRKRNGGQWDEAVPVTNREFVIGSAPSCDLRIQDSSVSLSHCRIVTQGGRVVVVDLESNLGTILNDRLILEPVEVRNGDMLRIGPAQFQFLIATGGGGSEKPGRGVASSPSRVNPDRTESPRPAGKRSPRGTSVGENLLKLHLTARGEVSVVKVLDNALITDQEIGDFTNELSRVIEEGHPRVALDFGNVKHMSSQVIGEVIHASRRCAEAGGKLKLCMVQPQVAAAFAITGMNRHLECYADAQQAVASEWPKTPRKDNGHEGRPGNGHATQPASPSGPAKRSPGVPRFRPSDASAQPATMVDFPIPELYLAPPECATTTYEQGGEFPAVVHPSVSQELAARASAAPTPAGEVDEPETLADIAAIRPVRDLPECASDSFESKSGPAATPAPPASRPDRPPVRVGLLVLEGKAKGKTLEVRERRFLIGRDPTCQLRPHSQWISRVHTSIEQRGPHVFVSDMGSTNGTTVNGHRLGEDEEVQVKNGDRLTLGPLQFEFAIAPGPLAHDPVPPPAAPPVEAEVGGRPIVPDADPVREPVAVAAGTDEGQVAAPPAPSPIPVPVPEIVPPNPFADLQFCYAIQPGLDVRLVPAADLTSAVLPSLTGLLGQLPQGWGLVEQLIQGLLTANSRGLVAPTPSVSSPPNRTQPVAVPTPTVALPVKSVAAPGQTPAVATPPVVRPAPPAAIEMSPSVRPPVASLPVPSEPHPESTFPLVPLAGPRVSVLSNRIDAPEPRSADATPADVAVGNYGHHDHEIEILLKDLPQLEMQVAPPAPPPVSKLDRPTDEDLVAVQKQLEAFLENLPEGLDESADTEEGGGSVEDLPVERGLQPQPVSHYSKEDINLDFECPACGVPGAAPISRLGRQLFCKACGAKFFFDGSGAVAGVQPVATKEREKRPSKKDTSDRINDHIDRALFFWQDIPQTVKVRGFVSVVVLSILPWLVNVLFFNDPLKAQSLHTVDALIHTDEAQLKAISTDKTASETLQWMTLVSSEVKKKVEGGAKTRVHIASQDSRIGTATVMVYFESRSQAAAQVSINDEYDDAPKGKPGAGSDDETVEVSSPPADRMKFLVLLWQKNSRGKWLLEGSKTLQYASRLTATPTPPVRAPGRPGTPKSGKPARPSRYYGWDGGAGPLPGADGPGPSPAVGRVFFPSPRTPSRPETLSPVPLSESSAEPSTVVSAPVATGTGVTPC